MKNENSGENIENSSSDFSIGSTIVLAESTFSNYYNIDLDDSADDAYVYLSKSEDSVKIIMWTKADLTLKEFPAIREEVSIDVWVWDGNAWDYIDSAQSIANLIHREDYDYKSVEHTVLSGL